MSQLVLRGLLEAMAMVNPAGCATITGTQSSVSKRFFMVNGSRDVPARQGWERASQSVLARPLQARAMKSPDGSTAQAHCACSMRRHRQARTVCASVSSQSTPTCTAGVGEGV